MSTLAAEDVEAIASRAVELLAERELATTSALVDAATLARELGVSRAYVYEHAEELGGIRLGSGTKPRLRFDAGRAKTAHNTKPPAPDVSDTPPRRRKPAAGRPTLLPIRSEAA